jgi:hypothetical protein
LSRLVVRIEAKLRRLALNVVDATPEFCLGVSD